MGELMGATNVVDEPTYEASSSGDDSSPADGHMDRSKNAKSWHPETNTPGQFIQVA